MSVSEQILLAFGGNAVLLTFLGFLTRSLIQTWLAKDIKKFEAALQSTAASEMERLRYELKSKGDASIEELRSKLQQATTEHQVRFAKLHDKQAEVIENVYQLLVDAEKGYGRFVLVDGYDKDTEKQQEARRKTEMTMYETSLYIEKHRIYLPAKICESLKTFLDLMWNSVISVGVYGSIDQPTPQTLQERQAAFMEAHQALVKEIPSARAALENRFRKMLGAEES